MREAADYSALIISEHATKPRFVATVEFSTDPLAQLQMLLEQLRTTFDIDTAVGAQLDAVGVRVGRARTLEQPLPGLFFTFGDPARGFGKGIWKGKLDTPLGVYALADDEYRKLLHAQVLANRWDGSAAGAQDILDAFFTNPETYVFVQDDGISITERAFTFGDPNRGFGQGLWTSVGADISRYPIDMAYKVCVAGKLPSTLDLALLGRGLVAPKPVGVAVDYAVTSVDGGPVFGFGVDNQYVGGFGRGAFAVSPDYITNNVILSAA